MKNKMRSKKRIKNNSFVTSLFFGLIIVTSLSHILASAIGVVDTQCISKFLGDDGLTAIGLTSPVIQIISMIAVIFSVGGQLVFTKLISKGDRENANKHLTSNFFFLLILGLVSGIILFFIASPLASFLTGGKSSDKVIKITGDYLKGLIVGLPFILIGEYLSSIVYLDNDRSRMSISMGVTFVSNILLDITLAKCFPNKAAFCIGIASSISYLISCVILLTHFFSKKSSYKFNLKSFKFSYIVESFKSGFVMGFTDIVITIRLYLLNLIMLTVGSLSKDIGLTGNSLIAASGIEGNVTSIFDLGLAGLVDSILMLGGVFYEEEDEKSLNELLKNVIKFSLIIGAILSITYFFSAPHIAKLYSDDEIIIREATFSMQANAISIIITSFTASLLAFLEVSKKNLLAHISTTLQSLVLPILLCGLLGFTIGSKGIWIGFPLGFLIYLIIHLSIAFIHAKKIKIDAKTLFFLPKSFGYSKDEIYEKEINSIKDVFTLHDDIIKYSNKLNIDIKDAENLANSTEELGSLIVLSGFTSNKNNKKKPHASLKVLYKKESKSLMIRSRDNCEKFDITDKINQIKIGTFKDIEFAPTLKILINNSKDIDYAHLLNTNNIIIKF